MPKILFNGDPGTTWVNNSGRVRYQFFCNWANTCGVCAVLDHAIGPIWPIPIHRNCRCFQTPIMIGAEAEPFVDYRAKVESLDPKSQAKVMGRAAYELVRRGVIKWEDVVTPTRVRTLQEVVAREKLTISRMTKSGIRESVARRAYEAVNTPAEAILKAHRDRLIENLRGAGLSTEQIVTIAAEKVASRLVISGPSGVQRLIVTSETLADILRAIAIENAILQTPKGQKPKVEVVGDLPDDEEAPADAPKRKNPVK